MEIRLNHIGGTSTSASKIIELIISNDTATIREDVTDSNGKVDTYLIRCLRDIAESLENQNKNL